MTWLAKSLAIVCLLTNIVAAEPPFLRTAPTDCPRTDSVNDVALSLFVELQLHAFRISEHVTRCDARLSDPASDDGEVLTQAWASIRQEVRAMNEILDQLAGGWHLLSGAGQAAVIRIGVEVQALAAESEMAINLLEKRTTPVTDCAHLLAHAAERAERIVAVVESLIHCGETGSLREAQPR